MNNREKEIYRHLNTHPFNQTERWHGRLNRLRNRFPREFASVLEMRKSSRSPDDQI